MLVQFTVGNFRSIHKPVTFSMLASEIQPKNKGLNEANIIEVAGLRLLKVATIYGPNGSGKSNLIKAFESMAKIITESHINGVSTEKFLLNTTSRTEPTFFEMIFILEGTRYRYGFEIDGTEIIEEWLYYVPNKRESKLFVRERDHFDIRKTFKEGLGLEKRTRPDALFLSVSSQFNGKLSGSIVTWFKSKLIPFLGLRELLYRIKTIELMKLGNEEHQLINRIMKDADVGMTGVKVENPSSSEEDKIVSIAEGFLSSLSSYGFGERGEEPFEKNKLISIHDVFDTEGRLVEEVKFNFEEQESAGTNKIFNLLGVLLFAIFEKGVILIDELDARLHPTLVKSIIRMFQFFTKEGGQLIFTTHNTHFLSNKIFRRDQIWFTEKNKCGETDAYSLAEIKVRNDASFEKDYIQGRYGAIPFLGGMKILQDFMEQPSE